MSIKAEKLPHGRIQGAKWSTYPVRARVVRVLVGETDWEWCKPYVGTMRSAIEVVKDDARGALYIDNAGGLALATFLSGKAPLPGFRILPAFAVFEDNMALASYQAKP